jgi:membrane protein DedA with SNARE-associated domain
MAEWIVDTIDQHGYPAIALLMLLENVFPPLPSELIMPFAGYAAGRGELHGVGVALAGTLGSVAGALLWYAIGRWLGAERLQRWAGSHGRWLTLSPQELQKAQDWFERRGHHAVLVGRLVPAVRTLVSVPAGITKMRLPRFLLWTSLGSLLWCGVLTALGAYLGERYESASGTLSHVTHAVIATLALAYGWRVATFGDKT